MTTLPIDHQFITWLGAAEPRDQFVYATSQNLGRLAEERPDTKRAAQLAMRAYAAGEVDLVQRRLTSGHGSKFSYIAIKRANVSPPEIFCRPDWWGVE